jgi:hypothetical protein
VVLNIQAGAFLYLRFRPDREHHERCWFDAIRYSWPAEQERDVMKPAVHVEVGEHDIDSFGPVLAQDLENIPLVQRGLHSSGLPAITVGQQETGIVALHRTIERYLSGHTLEP